jgi:hypothetical protein
LQIKIDKTIMQEEIVHMQANVDYFRVDAKKSQKLMEMYKRQKNELSRMENDETSKILFDS